MTTVPLWIYGLPAPSRLIDNTELANIAAGAMGVDLDAVTGELFAELNSISDLKYRVNMTDAANQYIQVDQIIFPFGRDYGINVVTREQLPMPGLTIYAPATGKAYLSQEAIRIEKRNLRKLHS